MPEMKPADEEVREGDNIGRCRFRMTLFRRILY